MCFRNSQRSVVNQLPDASPVRATVFFFQLRTAAFWGLLCDLGYTFQLSPPGVSTRVTTREHPAADGETVERNVRKFCLNANLLPLRRKVCWGFFRSKNPTASAGCEPANLGTKGQHATSRPPKPLRATVTGNRKDTGMNYIHDKFKNNKYALYYFAVERRLKLFVCNTKLQCYLPTQTCENHWFYDGCLWHISSIIIRESHSALRTSVL